MAARWVSYSGRSMVDTMTQRIEFSGCAIVCALMAFGSTGQAAEYDRRTAIVEAVAKTKDAIVNLQTMRVVPAKFTEEDSGGRVKGLGTGILIDPRGFVVTNHHVVEKVDTIDIKTADGREYAAHVVKSDEAADLAVLKIDARREFPYLSLDGAGKPLLGETVIAIGNPYGLETSITTGIVSAFDRELRLPNGELFRDLIQTDANINPGNSGGPLLDINGKLLGINVAIRTNAHRIGFAIPTDTMRRMIAEMMPSRRDQLRKQGLSIDDENLQLISKTQSVDSARAAVRIRRVDPTSPAYQVGFRDNDEIVRVSGQKVRLRFDIDRILWDRSSDEELVFHIRRPGAEETRTIRLGIPDERSKEDILWQEFGVRVQPVPASEVPDVVRDVKGGLRLTEVAPGSPAARAGFRPRDILIGLHEWSMLAPDNVRYVMQWEDLAKHQPVAFHLIRDRKLVQGEIHVPAIR